MNDPGDAVKASMLRAARHAFEAAHGNPIPADQRGFRWAVSRRVAVSVVGVVLLGSLVLWGWNARADSNGTPLIRASDGNDTMGARLLPLADLDGNSVREDPLNQNANKLWVHVGGEVRNPGLLELPTGSRVGDAVEAAGGVTDDARVDGVNLARLVNDGEQILVPSQNEMSDTSSSGERVPSDGKVNINTADAQALQDLPGIGPAMASRIVEYRQAHGSFRTVDELLLVSGIGEAKLASLRDLVTW